jgi:hypothetical protein
MSTTTNSGIRENVINKKGHVKPLHLTKGKINSFDRAVWNYMKNQLKISESEQLTMKYAEIPAKINSKPAILFKYFNPHTTEEKGIIINDYESLSLHPELILYEGYKICTGKREIVIRTRNAAGISYLDEKTKSGEITDIGLESEKSAGKKFLEGFGHFLMMGGFLLILIVGVAIAVGISILVGK